MQDRAIIEIGRLKGNKTAKPYQNFIQNMFPGKDYDIVLAMFKFQKEDGNYRIEFDKIDSQKAGEKNNNYIKYAYRKGSARGGDITFTTKFNNIEKLFSTIQNQLKKLIAFCEQEKLFDDLAFFNSFQNVIDKDTEVIEAELSDKWGSSLGNAKISLGFSFVFKNGEEIMHLEDFESIQKLLYQIGTAGKSEKYKVISEGHNEMCSICMEKKPVLHGFASPFKYATVDKTGLVSGFFNQKNNWKNYPICSDCALDFEMGQKYVTQYLDRYFYGKGYYLIPKLLIGSKSNPEELDKVLSILDSLKYVQSEGKMVRMKEKIMMREIAKQDNFFTLNLLFYEENPTTKAIKIKLMLEEIMPSRFQRLFVTAPKAIEKNRMFKDALIIKKVPQNLEFSFAVLRAFFNDDFYGIIQTVFMGLPLNEEMLFTKFMQLIRSNYNKKQTSDSDKKFIEPIYWTVLKAIMTILYLKELNIIPNHKNDKIMNVLNEPETNPPEKEKREPVFNEAEFEQFLKENKDGFLDSDVKIGVFLVGVYVRFLLNLQYNNMNKNTPFEKKFKGYNLNASLIKKLYLEAKDKISQFIRRGGFYTYKNLREKYINEYFFKNEHKLSELTDDQLSFYFVAGLEFANQFKNKNSKEDNND